mmetsp:Transcript_53378/g.95808  ORF Transcript_53378/g.95808 Transcript_53378/m.95808 type:complete len:328 (-) Transcript_53378:122-1105(-)
MGKVASALAPCCATREHHGEQSLEISTSQLATLVATPTASPASGSKAVLEDANLAGDLRPSVSKAAFGQRPARGPVTWAPSPPRSPAEKQQGRRWLPCGKEGSPSQPGRHRCAEESPVTSFGSGFFMPHSVCVTLGTSEAPSASASSDLEALRGSPVVCVPLEEPGMRHDHLVCRHGCCQAFRPGGEETKTDRLVRLIRQERKKQQVADFLERHGFRSINESRCRHLRLSSWYPLHCAVARGDATMVTLLLQQGADQSLRDSGGMTAYERALRLYKRKDGPHSEIMEALGTECLQLRNRSLRSNSSAEHRRNSTTALTEPAGQFSCI